MEGKEYFGFGLILLSIIMLISSNPLLWLDNSYYNKNIDFNNSNSTNLLINFTFDRSLIHQNYVVSNGIKVYQNYINIYSDEFLNNATLQSVSLIKLNSNSYHPINKTYEYSLQIEDEGLNPNYQLINITKTSGLNFNKMEISYYGANYANKTLYDSIYIVLLIIVLLIGVLILAV